MAAINETQNEVWKKRKRKRNAQGDIRSYMSRETLKEINKSKTKKLKSSVEDDRLDSIKGSSYVPALSLSTGVRQKRHHKDVLQSNDPTANKDSNDTQPILCDLKRTSSSSYSLPHQSPQTSPSRDKQELDYYSDDLSPVIVTESQQLSEESLLAVLNCNTQQFIAQL